MRWWGRSRRPSGRKTYYLDLTAKGANKGNAIRLLAEAQGIDVADIAVIGDMENDVPMFAVAGFSVAMGNASEGVKGRASVAAVADNDHGGWAEAVEAVLGRALMEGMSLDCPGALARQVAEWMVERFGGEPRGIVAVALSGGSTPKLLYTLLATDEFSGRIPWDRVHWCWGDERFVPPDDPSSKLPDDE